MDDLDAGLLQLSPGDNVAIVVRALRSGACIRVCGRSITLERDVAMGFKVAIEPLAAGAKVIRARTPIGRLTAPVEPGDVVHTHNLASEYLPTTRDRDEA